MASNINFKSRELGTEVLRFSYHIKPVGLSSGGFFYMVMFEVLPFGDTTGEKMGDTFRRLSMKGRTSNLIGSRFTISPDIKKVRVDKCCTGTFAENVV